MWGPGYWGGPFPFFWGIGWLVPIGLFVLFWVLVVRRRRWGWGGPFGCGCGGWGGYGYGARGAPADVEEILRQRLARGEIDEAQYQQLKEALRK